MHIYIYIYICTTTEKLCYLWHPFRSFSDPSGGSGAQLHLDLDRGRLRQGATGGCLSCGDVSRYTYGKMGELLVGL